MALKFFLGALVGLGAMLASPNAHAGAFGSLIGGPAELEDNDFEALVLDQGTLGRVEVGDHLLAIIEIQRSSRLSGTFNTAADGSVNTSLIEAYTPQTNAITGVSLIRVDSVSVSGDEATFTFTGASAANWLAVTGLVATDGAAAMLFDDPPSTPDAHIDESVLPTTDFLGEVLSAAQGTFLGEFFPLAWIATSEAVLGGDPQLIADIDDLDFIAALNTPSTKFAAHNVLADRDLSGNASGFFQGVGPADLQLQGSGQFGTSGEFNVKTETNLYIHAVPEPTSLAIFGLVGAAGVVARRRRNKK